LGHAVGDGIALGRQNVIDRIVGIRCGSQVVVPCLDDIGTDAVSIKGSNVAALDHDVQRLRCTGSQFRGLAEAYQGDGGFLNAVFLVVVGVGALGVDLHRFLARVGIAGVGDGDCHVELVGHCVISHLHVAVSKVGVAQAVAKGERHGVGIGIVAGVAGAHDHIFVAGLIILVSDVNAFLIDHIGAGICGDDALRVALVGDGGEVLHGGRRIVVVAVGIHQAAGRVDVAGKDLGHGIDAGNA